MAITGNPGDLATGGFGTGISGRAATPGNVASAVSRGNSMAAGRQGGGPGPAGGLLAGATRAGGWAGAAPASVPDTSIAHLMALSRGPGTLGLLGSTPVAPNAAEVAMQKARILQAALGPTYGNTGLMAGGIDALARTIAGEAAGETPLGQTAVAQTMLNRMALAAANPSYGYLNNLKQYSAYTDQNAPFQAAMPGTPEYDNALQAIANAMNPNNALPEAVQTATHYYASKGPNAINAPSWAKGQDFTQLGAHTFGLASELNPGTVASLLGSTPARPSAAEIANNAVAAVTAGRPISTTPAIPVAGPIDITPRPVAVPTTVAAAPTQVATNQTPFAYPSRPVTPTPSAVQQWAHNLLGTTNYGTGGVLGDGYHDSNAKEVAMAMLESGARKPVDSETTPAATDSGESWRRRKEKKDQAKDKKTSPAVPVVDIAEYVPQWYMDWYNKYGKTGGILA